MNDSVDVPFLPINEPQRVAALHQLHILDTPQEERFDRITRTAQRLFDVPIALISLVDSNRQWFKSCQGLDVPETPRSFSFCAYAILQDAVLVIPDAHEDSRFADNPLVTGDPYIRFYAGQPLCSPEGYRVGTLCLIDRRPRSFSDENKAALRDLAFWAENELNSMELHQALERVRAGEATRTLLAAIVESSDDAIFSKSLEGIILSWNRGAEQIYGYSAEEIVGKSISGLIPPERSSEMERILQAVQQGQRVESFETVRLHKDGTPIEVSLTISPLRDSSGLTVGASAIARDISERRRVEVALARQYQEAEQARGEMRAILDATSDAIILVGTDRRFLTVNRRFEEFFDQPAEQVQGRYFAELRPQIERVFEDPQHFFALVAGSATSDHEGFAQVVRQVWPQPRDLLLYSAPVQSQGNLFLGRLYVLRDITREREVERLKNEFVSMVSHELRTPLTGILGYVDVMLEGVVGEFEPEQQKFLKIVRSNAKRLMLLINDLLDVARIEAGKLELHKTEIALSSLIQMVADSFHLQLQAKQQALTVHVPPGLPSLWGDTSRLMQVLTNLLSNAHKYTPAGGQIAIEVKQAEQEVQIAVQDSGIGLTVEEQEQLFTKFFRARNRTTQEVGGTGLGLSISRELVRLHGGEILVESTPGIGSTFTIRLPLEASGSKEEGIWT